MLNRTVVCLCLAWFSGLSAAHAEPSAGPLRAGDILKSSAAHAPQILERLALAKKAEGEALSSEGAFDTVVETEGFARLSGFYDGRVAGTTLSQDLRFLGATVFGGYRVSDGTFPIYEDRSFTNSSGEIKAGLALSLLRGRSFDKQRADVAKAAIALSAAQIEVLKTSIGVQHKALKTYYQWVAAGAQLLVYRNLLDLSIERERGLQRRVSAGDRARFLLVENKQNVLKREMLVAEAERQLNITALALSMFYRDASGEPIVPSAVVLPDGFPPLDQSAVPVAPGMIDAALADRPELALVEQHLAKARTKLRLAENDLQPNLNLKYEVSRDLGEIAEGGISRDGVENVVGLEFKIPLQRSFAKGRRKAARAEMQALELRRQRLEEQIAVDIRTLRTELDTARRMVVLTGEEQVQAETMQQFEQQRFRNGASDFFLLNVREETAADARIRRIAAQLRYFMARADFHAAIVDLEALGL